MKAKRVRDMIRHPLDDKQAGRKADFEAIVALPEAK